MMDGLELYSIWWVLKYDIDSLESIKDSDFSEFIEKLDSLSRKPLEEFYEDQRRRIENSNAKIITVWDESYPKLLREITSPPPVLFCLGDESVLRSEMFSIVGTRKSDDFGNKLAEKFSSEIAEHFVVVSGMAYGIDRHAHIGAMRSGKTVAVLASGVDVPSPSGNSELYHGIIESGCVLSVYPLGSSAKRHRFPERNALIAGLSVGTLVVRAPMRSGALITANYAADFGRDVFAIPGDVGKLVSEGTNFLIKSGAIPVTSPSDILEYYGLRRQEGRSEDPILDLVRKGFDTVEALAEELKMDLGEVLAKITELELSGKLENDGGKLRLI